MEIAALLARSSFVTVTVIVEVTPTEAGDGSQKVSSAAVGLLRDLFSASKPQLTSEDVDEPPQLQLKRMPAALPLAPTTSGSVLAEASTLSTCPAFADCSDPPARIATSADGTTFTVTDVVANLPDEKSVAVSCTKYSCRGVNEWGGSRNLEGSLEVDSAPGTGCS